jgi:hypothetical protein
MYVCMCVCMHVRVCMCVCVYVRMRACVSVRLVLVMTPICCVLAGIALSVNLYSLNFRLIYTHLLSVFYAHFIKKNFIAGITSDFFRFCKTTP